jgi:hypothetical protein
MAVQKRGMGLQGRGYGLRFAGEEQRKSRLAAAVFLFYPSIFRIPSLDGFTAKVWQVFWRGNCFVSMLVTFVRAGGGLTRFPQTSSKADIRLRGSQVEGNVTGSAALVPSCAEEPVRLAGSRRLAQGRLCGSKEGAARPVCFPRSEGRGYPPAFCCAGLRRGGRDARAAGREFG